MRKWQKGWIYFIEAMGADAVKIGFAWRDVPARVSVIQVHNHLTVRVIGTIRNRTTMERAIHLRFRHLHIRGEWFRLETELRDFIEANTVKGVPLPVYIRERQERLKRKEQCGAGHQISKSTWSLFDQVDL